MPEPIKTDVNEPKDDALGGDTLQDLLNPPSSVEEPTSDAAKSDDADKKSALTAEDVEKLIAKAREKDEERFGELEQTLTYYKGRLAERDESRQPETKKEDEIGEFTYDEAKLAEGMAENAPRTLAKLVDDLGKHLEKKIRKELTKDVDGRLYQDQAMRARASAWEQDRAGVEKEYGDYLKDKDFLKEADSEIAAIITKRGGKAWADYMPGDLESAASRVVLRWLRAGKGKQIAENDAATRGNGLSLREVVRRVPQSDSLGNGNGRAASGPPKTIDQLFTNERDRKIAKKVIAKQGVSEEAYVRNYLRAREDDEDYDRAN